MDLGRPIARHFARRPHEGDDAAASTPVDDLARTASAPPAVGERRDRHPEGAVEPEPDTPRTGRTGP